MSVSIQDFEVLINRIPTDWLTGFMGNETVWMWVAGVIGGIGFLSWLYNLRIDIAKEERKLDAWETSSRNNVGSKAFDTDKLWDVFCDYRTKDGGEAPTEVGEEEDKAKAIATTLQKGKAGDLPLLDERLLTITSMVHESNNVSIMPSVSEMHDLSLQSVESKTATKLLSICASSVLVCGICGTLWGVHHKLATMDVLDIEQLGVCLEPSMVAVICNIILVSLRNSNAAMLDRLVEKLDELTIAQFIPALQPDNNFGQTLEDFVEATRALKEDNRLEYVSQTPKTIAEMIAVTLGDLHELVTTMLGHASCMKSFFLHMGRIRDVQSLQRAEAEKVQEFTKDAENRMNELKETLDGTIQIIQTLGASLPEAGIPEDLQEAHRQALENARRTQQEIADAIGKVQAWQGTCNSIMEKSAQHSANLYDEWNALYSVATSLQPLASGLQELEQSFSRLYSAAEDGRTLFDADAVRDKFAEAKALLEGGTEEMKTKSDTAVESFKEEADGLVDTLGNTLESIGGVKRALGEAERLFVEETQDIAPVKPLWWLPFLIGALIAALVSGGIVYYYYNY